jgi:hypothetical protein
MFKSAAEALLRGGPPDAQRPQARKRRSGGDSRAAVSGNLIKEAKAEATAWPMRAATTGQSIMPSEMLDRLYIWQSETTHSAAHHSGQGSDFDAKQNYLSPQL